jgi:N-acetyl-anhydromuramyl-L-alanine amidase AmpD
VSSFIYYTSSIKADIGRPVLHWDSPGGFSFYRARDGDPKGRKFYRDISAFQAAAGTDSRKTNLQQVVLHLDGARTSAQCFAFLKSRGCSTHIMIDWDGTVYQPLAIKNVAWHAPAVNQISVGIDLCNPVKPSKVRHPGELADRGIKQGVINGGRVKALGYTEAQYEALLAVLEGLFKLFPGIKRQVPADANGRILRNKLASPDFQGVVGHYHVQANRWDPGPGFDWERVIVGIKGKRFFYPITLGGTRNLAHVPKKKALENAEPYFAHIEGGTGGFFPIGRSQTWHSGVHIALPALAAGKRVPVLAPADGEIVAARMVKKIDNRGLGSPNMVLIKSAVEAGSAKGKIFTLLAHLDSEPLRSDSPIKWIRDLMAQDGPAGLPEGDEIPMAAPGFIALRNELVALVTVPIKAGDVIGHVGRFRATKDEKMQEMIEMAVMSAKPVFKDGMFDTDDTDDDPGILCNSRKVWKHYTEDPRKLQALITGGFPLSDEEIIAYYNDEDKRGYTALRWLAPRHATEYSIDTDFSGMFGGGVDFEWALLEDAKEYKKEIRAFLWWNQAVAKHAGLPEDGLVYTYHPIALFTTLAVDGAKAALDTLEAQKAVSDKDLAAEKRRDAAREAEFAELSGTSVDNHQLGSFDATKDVMEAAEDVDRDDDGLELENWMHWEQGEWEPE